MTLPKLGRLLLITTMIFVLANYLPEFYWLKFDTPVSKPIVNYSPVLNKFMIGRYDGIEFGWKDDDNKKYTRDEYEIYCPASNYRQLLFDKKLPDSINGEKMDLDSLRLHRIMMRITPQIINSWQIPLYPLLESESGRIKLAMPDDFFRIDDKGITFINAEKNQIDEEKSRVFTEVMRKKKFQFPVKLIAGNPSTMKPFDEGYFILDSMGNLFHLKMVKGKPFFTFTSNPIGTRIKHILFQETNLRSFYGFAITEDNRFFCILTDDYKFLQLPVDDYNFNENKFVYMGDYLNKNLLVESDKIVTDYVTDRNHRFIKKYENLYYDGSKDAAISAANILFPYTISFVDANSGMVDIFFKLSNLSALWGIAISMILSFVILRKRRKAAHGFDYADIMIVALSGIYGLIAVILIKNVD